MRKKHSSKISLFSQYFLTYLCAVFIPACVTCVSLFFSYQTLKTEVVSSNQTSLQLIQQSLDAKIKELNNTLLSMESDASLTSYALEKKSLSAISSLKKMVALQDCISDIIITSNTSSIYYSALGSYSTSALEYQSFMKNLNSLGYSCGEWIEMMESTITPTYWPSNAFEREPNYLYLFSPVYSSFQHTKATSSRAVVLLIKQDFIQDLFRSSQTEMDENILLLNSNMELLSHLTSSIETKESILEICDYLKNNTNVEETGSLICSYNGNLLFVSRSLETSLYYVRYLPREIAYSPIYKIRSFTMVCLFLAVISGIFIITFGMKRSYLPIRALADWVKDVQNNDSEIKNELVFFKETFEEAFKKNADLSQTLDYSRHGLTEQLLTALIQGNFATEETFHNACRNLDIHLERKYYCVCSLLAERSSKTNDSALSFERIKSLTQRILPKEILCEMKDLLFANKLLFILNSDDSDPLLYQTAMLEVKTCLLEQENLIISIGMGSVCDSFEKVGKSYLESVNALDYRLIYGKDCLITPDMYNDRISETSYPTSELEFLSQAFLSHNAELAVTAIHKLNEYTKSQKCSLHAAKYICYDIFSILKKTPAFLSIGYVNTLSQNLNITQLTSFDTIDEFFVSLLEVV